MTLRDRTVSRHAMLGCATLALAVLPPALAGDGFYDRKKLCTAAGYVDKEALAKRLVEHDRIGSTFRNAVPPAAAATNAGLLAALIRMGDSPCDTIGTCSEEERLDSDGLMARLVTLFAYPPAEFTLAKGVTKENFFATPNDVNPLLCVATPAQNAAGGKASWLAALRVRGHPDDLVISQQEAEFKAAKPAVFSVDRDELADTRTISSNAYLGILGQERREDMTKTAWLGYLGMARSSTRVDGTEDPDRKLNQLHAGIIFDRHHAGRYRLALRPTYFHDRVDGTRVAAVDAVYTPYWPLTDNKLRASTNLLINFPAFAIRPVVKAKLHAGHFTNRSRDPDIAAYQENYLRAGGVLGADLFAANLPVEYHFSYTGLARLRGPSSIHHVTHALGLSLDPNDYTSLVLDYSRGTNEETLLREKRWKLTFAFRY